MGNAANITGWITFFVGLYALAAGIGEFRRPGFWAKMVSELRASSALQFLTGMVTLTIGAVIYLVNPYNPSDWLSILITVMGAFMFLEGMAIFAFGDWFLRFAARMMGSKRDDGSLRIWAGFSVFIGLAAMFVAFVRLQVVTFQ